MRPRIGFVFRVIALAVLLALPGHTAVARLLSSQHETGPLGVCPPVQGTPFFTIAYGTVTLDGDDAPVGTLVEARSPRGDVAGCFEVTGAGNYGMMYVYGEDNTVTPPIPGMRAGETVAFYVNGSPAAATPTLVWANDKTWHQVDLVASGGVSADFSGTPRQGTADLTVTFSNLSAGDFTSCTWDFGDGGTSTDCNDPSYEYTSSGTYTVALTVSGLGGTDTITRTDYITVYTPVDALFTASPTSGVAPLIVDFTNQSTGDYDASVWEFGDGVTSTLSSPSHTYTAPGIYTVTLAIDGPGGSDTESKPGHISVEQFEFALDIETIGQGEVGKEPDQPGYLDGDVVTLSPIAGPAWSFHAWSGPDASDLSDNGDGSWDLVMRSDRSVTATFTQDEYRLEVSTFGEGTVTNEPHQETYVYGEVVTLTATAELAWVFADWGGDIESIVNPLTLTIESDTNLTARFCYWADLTGDCVVDVADIQAVAARWRCEHGDACYDPRYDVDGDGRITVVDIMMIAAEWGWSCP